MSVIEVAIKAVVDDQRGKYEGATITGYNKTDDKGFKQFVFKSGHGKGLYDDAMRLNGGDVAEFTMEQKGEYLNIEKIVKTGSDVGGGGGGSTKSSGGSGGSDKMTKAEWAAKDAAKELNISRNSALKAAVAACAADGAKVTKSKMEQVEKMAFRFQSYLLNGDFEGILPPPVLEPKTEAPSVDAPPADQTGPSNEDIPF